MKTRVSGIGLVAMLVCGGAFAAPISEQETSRHTYPVSSSPPHLYVRNIWGSVNVRAGNAGEIGVTINERRMATTQESFERSKELIRLEVDARRDGVSMIVRDSHGTGAFTDTCRGCRVDYQLEISVPPDTQVDVSTVTDGRVELTGVRGLVHASNVNGPVVATDLSDCAKIESVNGALDLQFSRAPSDDCTIETINGDIAIGLPADTGLNAILSIDRGNLESDFDVEPVMLPVKLEEADRHAYPIVRPAGVRLGVGGPTFVFASLNGDVRIRKNE